MDQYFDVRKVYRGENNSTPYYITVHPRLSAISGFNDGDEELYFDSIERLLKQGIRQMVRSTGLHWNNARIETLPGQFFIANITSGDQSFSSNTPFRVSHITIDSLTALFETLQSAHEVSMFDLEWTFVFFITPFLTGNGAPKKIPSYIDQKDIETWKPQFYQDIQINCAAFCLAYKRFSNFGLERVRKEAYDLMVSENWLEDVSFYDLLNIIPRKFPQFRLTIIMPVLLNHQEKTIEGFLKKNNFRT